MSKRETLWPVVVEGTQIAHLAYATLDDTGAGFRAICPAAPLIRRPLQLIPAGSHWLWCGACRSWAAAAGVALPMPGGAGVGMPVSGDGPTEAGSSDRPAAG